MCENSSVINWVKEVSQLTKPEKIVWIDGSKRQLDDLYKQAEEAKELVKLCEKKWPGCYYHKTDLSDVARVEHLTYICTKSKDTAGPTNNWMQSSKAYEKLENLFDSSMKGRTLYVVPYLLGPEDSKFSKVGIEITDSIYVVLNMDIMTRIGDIALRHLGNSSDYVKGLHSKGELNPEKRYICHFPEDKTIWSFGSGYGGNVLLGKKCFGLRLASYMGKQEGWLAEHMLILGLEDPKGEITYIAAAFPSACGKTNLAMLMPSLENQGYKVWTVGDDIAWMRIGEDGKLWAINPEAGFFGVVPGTNHSTNPNMMHTIKKDTIFTNVVLSDDGNVWWEGMEEDAPDNCLDWRGNSWCYQKDVKGAHPNSRFTTPAKNCPVISKEWENPQGVPISAIIFGGRRAKLAPLVYESFDWNHGVFVGATMASETTAAATGETGIIRRDPMAMLPFCGYNMAEYFEHWIDMGNKMTHPPKVFHVNWFRTDENGKFIWPGFKENFRVLKWIVQRCQNKANGKYSELGYLPYSSEIDLNGLDFSVDKLYSLLSIDVANWKPEVDQLEDFFEQFGDKLPNEISIELDKLKTRLGLSSDEQVSTTDFIYDLEPNPMDAFKVK